MFIVKTDFSNAEYIHVDELSRHRGALEFLARGLESDASDIPRRVLQSLVYTTCPFRIIAVENTRFGAMVLGQRTIQVRSTTLA